MKLKKLLTAAAVAIIGFGALTSAASGMQFNYDPTTHYLSLSGPVIPSDGDTFYDYLEKYPHEIKRVLLGPSPGGDAGSGIVIADAIFMNHIPTEDVDYCASACAFMFSGGRNTTMYVDNDTYYFVLAHCAEGVARIDVEDYSLTPDDIETTRNMLLGMGFNTKFSNDYVKLCNIKDNNKTFNYEQFLLDHGYKIQYLKVKRITDHGINDNEK